MLGINFLSFQHWKQIQGQHTIKFFNQTPTGWPMGVPGSRGALGRSPKNLMIQDMLGINFLSFQHWKWIQGQHTIKISNQTPMGWPMGVPGSKGTLGRCPKNLLICTNKISFLIFLWLWKRPLICLFVSDLICIHF